MVGGDEGVTWAWGCGLRECMGVSEDVGVSCEGMRVGMRMG